MNKLEKTFVGIIGNIAVYALMLAITLFSLAGVIGAIKLILYLLGV